MMLALLDERRQSTGSIPIATRIDQVAKALRDARRGDVRAVDRAETMLSQAFVSYARDLGAAPNIGVVYVDRELVPARRSPRALLDSAAAAPSLEALCRTTWAG